MKLKNSQIVHFFIEGLMLEKVANKDNDPLTMAYNEAIDALQLVATENEVNKVAKVTVGNSGGLVKSVIYECLNVNDHMAVYMLYAKIRYDEMMSGETVEEMAVYENAHHYASNIMFARGMLSQGDMLSNEAAYKEGYDDGYRAGCVDTNANNTTEGGVDALSFVDNVNSPQHYMSSNGIECIEAIKSALTEEEFRGYCKGNVIKYTWRERKKGGDESLRKATWYIARLVGDSYE